VSPEFARSQRRSAATSLVWDFMVRDEREDGLHSARTPILLFTGVRGSGQTELLNDLQGLLAGKFPHAYISGEWPFTATRHMLALLAFDLNQASGYGKLAFPRLLTGEIVIDADVEIDPLDREHAREQVIALLADHRKVKGVLENSISALVRSALTPVQAHMPAVLGGAGLADLAGNYGAEAMLGGLATRRRGRAVLLGTGQEWWGHQDRGLDIDPIDGLVNLRMAADRARAQRRADDASAERRDTGADSRRKVTHQLWAAFLADLRDSFRDRRRAINWTGNCVLLLDNADTPVARAFLGELVSVRMEREGGEPDPLTVVATSRGDLATRVSGAGLTPLAEASKAHYRTRTGAGAWWYPILLPALNWAQTGTMIDALQIPDINAEAATAAVHGFTCGHPGATSALLAAVAACPPPTGVVSLPALLAAKHPALADRERTVQDTLLDGLLPPKPEEDQVPEYDLATCCAARHKEAAQWLDVSSGLLEQQPGEVKAIFSPELWLTDPAGGHAALHPLLRRLLLRRLADRPADAKASWARVHLWLRAGALRAGHADAALYHALALTGTRPEDLDHLLPEVTAQEKAAHEERASRAHEAWGEMRAARNAEARPPRAADPLEHEEPLEHVARQLASWLERDDAATWLRRVASITAAPNRLDLARRPRDQVVTLTQWVGRHEEPIAPVARYLAYCWLGADPLSAPSWRWLLGEMASELDRIAPYSGDGGLSDLRDEAERYRYLAEGSWRDIGDFWMDRATATDDTKPSQGTADGN
jgi:hypothetical protein